MPEVVFMKIDIPRTVKRTLPHRDMLTSMEAKYRYLSIIPFHGGFLKVKGKVDGFTELKRESTLVECPYDENVK